MTDIESKPKNDIEVPIQIDVNDQPLTEIERLRIENRELKKRLAAHKHVDTALGESEAKFRHIYDNSPVMMHSIDKNGNICNVNKKWLENTGYSRAEVIGQRADFLMTPESAERAFDEVIPQFWRDGFVRSISYKYVKKNAEVFDVLLDCNATVDPAGKSISLSVTRDVTEKKRVEAELHQYQERLELLVQERTAELETVLGELRAAQEKMVHQARMASLGTMMAGFAHEVRNPLNFTIGGTRNIQNQIGALWEIVERADLADNIAAEISDCLVRAERALELLGEGNQRIGGIVGHLQAFSESRSRPRNERCNLAKAINATLILVRDLLQRNEISVDWSNPEISEVAGNRVELNQVFMNLIINACQAMPEGGRLRIEALETSESINLSFQDTGPGIAATIRDKIFDPFFTTHKQGDGTGLGLSISHSIIKRHGGDLIFRETQKGACFVLTIPKTPLESTNTDLMTTPQKREKS